MAARPQRVRQRINEKNLHFVRHDVVMAPESRVESPVDDPLEIEPPNDGRIHSHRRRVQLADTSPKGRARLDALARMLQDVSDEDTTDAGFPPDEPWVVRRVDLGIEAFPAFRDMVTVSTWCSGIGGRWAERRVRIVGDAGGRVEAAVLWVHLDAWGRPARLPSSEERTSDLQSRYWAEYAVFCPKKNPTSTACCRTSAKRRQPPGDPTRRQT